MHTAQENSGGRYREGLGDGVLATCRAPETTTAAQRKVFCVSPNREKCPLLASKVHSTLFNCGLGVMTEPKISTAQ